MFAVTPRLRDGLDARKLVLVGIAALVAFALQLSLLAGTVASPLGQAIADLDRIPQFGYEPAQALARSDFRPEPAVEPQSLRMIWEAAGGTRPRPLALPEYCILYR